MWCPTESSVYINPCATLNKSVLNWTQVCQLLLTQVKTQLHEIRNTPTAVYILSPVSSL